MQTSIQCVHYAVVESCAMLTITKRLKLLSDGFSFITRYLSNLYFYIFERTNNVASKLNRSASNGSTQLTCRHFEEAFYYM